MPNNESDLHKKLQILSILSGLNLELFEAVYTKSPTTYLKPLQSESSINDMTIMEQSQMTGVPMNVTRSRAKDRNLMRGVPEMGSLQCRSM